MILSTIECKETINNNMINLLGLSLTNLHSHLIKTFTSFPIINQRQPTKLLNPNSSANELKIILLTVNFLINYIN